MWSDQRNKNLADTYLEKACISWNTVGKHEVKSPVIEIMLAEQFRYTDTFNKELFRL